MTHTIYQSSGATGGGLVHKLRQDAIAVVDTLHDGAYAFAADLGALDAPELIPAGPTRQETCPWGRYARPSYTHRHPT